MSDAEASVPVYFSQLQSIPRWCKWRLMPTASGRFTKVPDQSTARIDECRPWTRPKPRLQEGEFEVKLMHGSSLGDEPRTSERGVGLVLTGEVLLPDGRRLLAIDLDACITEHGEITAEASQWLDQLDSATEVSPSGYGLRIYVAVMEQLPQNHLRTKVCRKEAAPAGVDKTPECQLFGTGPAGYVTVTGNHLQGTPQEIRTVQVADLERLFGLHPAASATNAVVPTGWGAEPAAGELEAAVLDWKHGRRLCAAEWEGLDYDSASEAYFALVTVALRAARGHGEAVVDFLLGTAWGAGLVPESRDPGKYSRESWVRREVARAAAKSTAADDPAAVFEPVADPPAKPADGLHSGNGHTAPQENAGGPPRPAGPQLDSSAPPSEGASAPSRSRLQPTDPPPRRNPLQIVTVAELFARERPGDLWFRMMPRGSLSIWFGIPKCGKSYLALALGMAVAEGKPFLGRPTVKGRVLYVAGEGVQGVADKVAAGISPERAKDAADPFHNQFFVLPSMPRLTDPKTLAAVLAAVESLGGVDLVIVDTVARAIGVCGLDENSAEDTGAFVAALDVLRMHTGAAALGVHHENKQGGDRGSSALRGAADVFVRVERVRRRCSSLTVQDMRDGEPPEPIEVTFESKVIGYDQDATGTKQPIERWRVKEQPDAIENVFELGSTERAVLAVLRDFGIGMTLAAIARESGIPRETVRRTLPKLLVLGHIEESIQKDHKIYRIAMSPDSTQDDAQA
jgi:hypothetical protein